jgi:hypothetical protein
VTFKTKVKQRKQEKMVSEIGWKNNIENKK